MLQKKHFSEPGLLTHLEKWSSVKVIITCPSAIVHLFTLAALLKMKEDNFLVECKFCLSCVQLASELEACGYNSTASEMDVDKTVASLHSTFFPLQRAASRRDAATLTESSSERPDQVEPREWRPVGVSHCGRLDEPVEQKDDELLQDGRMRDTAVQAGSAMRRSGRCV